MFVRKFVSALLCLLVIMSLTFSVHAETVGPFGPGQIGLHGAILCEELTLRAKPSFSGRVIKTLNYGDFILVTEQIEGWARVCLGDDEDAVTGWVNSDYIVVDPAWYRTEKKTTVYAWKSTVAPKVALLEVNQEMFDSDTFLPVLMDEGDWILVSLRGAVGWIRR